MLQELRIRNFAIIDEVDLALAKGFNVLTGETGAGKSIILNAVQLLMGDKATEELIRSSEEEASVEALFDLSGNKRVKESIQGKHGRSQDAGDEDTLIVRRVISRSGRGKVFVNGHLATLGMLSEIGEELLSIYGQHEHQTLQRVETHVDILDEFGGFIELRDEFQKAFQEFIALSEEVNRIRSEQERRAKEQDLMAFQAKEIEASGLQMGEEEALKEEKRILVHAEKLMGFAHFSEETLCGKKVPPRKIQAILRKGERSKG
jgi:DNA repair protein RecN (Recombination protein N)